MCECASARVVLQVVSATPGCQTGRVRTSLVTVCVKRTSAVTSVTSAPPASSTSPTATVSVNESSTGAVGLLLCVMVMCVCSPQPSPHSPLTTPTERPNQPERSSVSVSWLCDGDTAEASLLDDGVCVCVCADCECSAAGTVENSCRPHPQTRTCVCKLGFTGDHCDACAPGFHGLNCQGETPSMTPMTTEVNSLSHTLKSIVDSYDWWSVPTACRCSGPGCLDGSCDPVTGHGVCRTGFQGYECDQCAAGYFNFPLCQCESNSGGRGCDDVITCRVT